MKTSHPHGRVAISLTYNEGRTLAFILRHFVQTLPQNGEAIRLAKVLARQLSRETGEIVQQLRARNAAIQEDPDYEEHA